MSELILPPRLDLAAASALLAQAKDLAATGEDCRLLARDVSSIGTACLQTLLALERALGTQGRRLTMVDPSQTMRDGMRQLGMETEMIRWMEAA